SLIKSVVIDGPGANLLALSGDTEGDGTNDVRILEVEAQAVVQGLTLRDGFDPISGGGIEVFPGGDLRLSYSAISNCIAGQWGGGVDVFEGSLAVDHSLICANATDSSSGQGGGGISIYSTNACAIADTTFSGNVQGSASGLGGAAIYAENANPAFQLV